MNAVVVRGVVKCYGNKKDEQRILNYLNMTVKYGSVYVMFVQFNMLITYIV